MPNPENFESKISKEKVYFDILRPLATIFSGYGFYELRVDPFAQTFYFDHKNKTINISPFLIESLNLDAEEKKYIFLHEVSHLIQLLQDPDSYLRTFEIPKEKADKVAQNEPELKKAIENAWHNFFNAFLDIHANSIIRAQMPIYHKGGRLEELPRRLYSEKMFPNRDYSSEPLSTQLLDYLLRRVMVPEKEIQINDKVREKINQKINFFGREYSSVEDFVQKEIFNSEKTITEQVFIFEKFLIPIYEELLEEDKKSGRIKEIQRKLGDFPVEIEISEEDAKKLAEVIKEIQKSPDKKYQENLDEIFKNWAKDKGFSEEEIKRMEEIKERTLKIIEDLEDIWENFIQRSTEFTIEKTGGYKRGVSISPEKLISQLPILLTNPKEAEVFARYLPETKSEEIKPKKINLELIVDLSGSMDEDKRKAVQEVAYAINKSLINFYRTGVLSVADSGAEFPVTINYRILGFGDTVGELTETTEEEKRERAKKDRPNRDLDEELIRAILKIEKIDLVGTQDAKALRIVEQEITPEIEEKLKNGDEILVILEITDGETTTVNESKNLVEKLNNIPNVYCRAIQIPGPIYSEKSEEPKEREIPRPPKILPPTGTFKEIWGDKFGKRLEDLGILKETVLSILADALRNYAQ
jgi:hypothetical protein